MIINKIKMFAKRIVDKVTDLFIIFIITSFIVCLKTEI